MSTKELEDFKIICTPPQALFTPEEEEQLIKLRDFAFSQNKTEEGYRCSCCGKIFKMKKDMQIDLIKPLCKGGELAEDNVKLICRYCNFADTVDFKR